MIPKGYVSLIVLLDYLSTPQYDHSRFPPTLPSLKPSTHNINTRFRQRNATYYVRVTGGEVGTTSLVATEIKLLGLSPTKIGEDIAKDTAKDRKGLRVTFNLIIQNRQAKVSVVPFPRSMVKELTWMVKEILRMYVSIGCTVDGKDPKDLQHEIANGDVKVSLDWSRTF